MNETSARRIAPIQASVSAAAWQARVDLAAMACNTEGEMPSPAGVETSCSMDAPGSSRSDGPLAWPGLLRMLDRTDPGFRV